MMGNSFESGNKKPCGLIQASRAASGSRWISLCAGVSPARWVFPETECSNPKDPGSGPSRLEIRHRAFRSRRSLDRRGNGVMCDRISWVKLKLDGFCHDYRFGQAKKRKLFIRAITRSEFKA